MASILDWSGICCFWTVISDRGWRPSVVWEGKEGISAVRFACGQSLSQLLPLAKWPQFSTVKWAKVFFFSFTQGAFRASLQFSSIVSNTLWIFCLYNKTLWRSRIPPRLQTFKSCYSSPVTLPLEDDNHWPWISLIPILPYSPADINNVPW